MQATEIRSSHQLLETDLINYFYKTIIIYRPIIVYIFVDLLRIIVKSVQHLL